MSPPNPTPSHINGDREPSSPSPAPRTLVELWEDEDGDDEDGDDMEYQPPSEQSGDNSRTEDEDSQSEYMDANEQLSGVEIEFSVGGGGDDDDDDDDDEGEEDDGNATETAPSAESNHAPPRTTTTRVTIEQINQVLGSHGPLRRLLLSHYRLVDPSQRGGGGGGGDDDDNEEDYGTVYGRFASRRRKPKPAPNRFPKVPNEQGKVLMDSGIYGGRDCFVDTQLKRKSNVSERLMWRKLGLDPRGTTRRANRLIAQELIPDSKIADKIIHYDSRAYSGQFSDDGNFFFSCTQNFKVRMYDTSNIHDWKYYKTVDYPYGQWTITDATLSPDNRFLAYSSIRHMVCLAPTDPFDPSDHTLLDFTNFARGSSGGRAASGFGYMGRNGFGIWSLRFSGDGREIVAGTSDHNVVVYDLERRQSILKLQKHDEDVNAVCFGDTSSPHILYSGSDDQTLRVWDRRSMGDGREAGVFVGHTEGLTYVDSKGDGRYVLSNGKDQMMKLWDLRKMIAPSAFEKINLRPYSQNFDYRFTAYDQDEYRPNPADCSVVTFRGHSVLKTLIRCHFSPPGSTNSRYVYSGSEDGKVHIWNMDATVKAKIDVEAATKGSRPRQPDGLAYGYEMHGRQGATWKTCVRDASWHPNAPMIAATSWNGWGMGTGTVTQHSWNDGAEVDEAEPAMGMSYNCRLDMKEEFNDQTTTRRTRGARGGLRSRVVPPRRLGMDEDEDGDDGTRREGGGAW